MVTAASPIISVTIAGSLLSEVKYSTVVRNLTLVQILTASLTDTKSLDVSLSLFFFKKWEQNLSLVLGWSKACTK